MATTSNIRGMLLEEAVLRLLTVSDYTAVSYDASKPDPTLDEDKRIDDGRFLTWKQDADNMNEHCDRLKDQ